MEAKVIPIGHQMPFSGWFNTSWMAKPDARSSGIDCMAKPVAPDEVQAPNPEMIAWSGSDGRMSGIDAVDGSSTGTEVPWMWVLLRPPRFGGATHASGHDNWSRYRQVCFSNPRS